MIQEAPGKSAAAKMVALGEVVNGPEFGTRREERRIESEAARQNDGTNDEPRSMENRNLAHTVINT